MQQSGGVQNAGASLMVLKGSYRCILHRPIADTRKTDYNGAKVKEGEHMAYRVAIVDAMKAYLDELDTDLNTVDTVVKTGNAMADAILSCNSEDGAFTTEILIPQV